MSEIKTQDLIDAISRRCDDTTHTKQEALDAYEEIVAYCDTAADALRDEIQDGIDADDELADPPDDEEV